MHQKNCFITLTYSDENLPQDGKLNYTHFQLFFKRLRKYAGKDIGFFMCGEYGETTQRPHYHACIFGWDPEDKQIWNESKHGDTLWTSKKLDELWGMNDPEKCPNKIGQVTQKSAGYVARYVLKKQGGPLGFQKMSRTHAIGKKFIEKWWQDVFIAAKGSIILEDGKKAKVPRYYEKWLKLNHPEEWLCYTTKIKPENTQRLKLKNETEHAIYLQEREARGFDGFSYQSPLARKRDALKEKSKQLIRSYL